MQEVQKFEAGHIRVAEGILSYSITWQSDGTQFRTLGVGEHVACVTRGLLVMLMKFGLRNKFHVVVEHRHSRAVALLAELGFGECPEVGYWWPPAGKPLMEHKLP